MDDTEGYTNGSLDTGMQSAEDVARLVFKFVEAAGLFVDGLDKDEEVRLLRVRMKKNELVIVPSMSLASHGKNYTDAYRPQVSPGSDSRHSSSLRDSHFSTNVSR
jgi:hypothetical protein